MKTVFRNRGLRSGNAWNTWRQVTGVLIFAVYFAVQPASAVPSTNCGSLVFNRLQASGTNFILEWFSQPNTNYEIAATTNLASNNWTIIADSYPASSSNLTSFVDVGAVSNKAKFYKVAQQGISIDLCNSNVVEGVLNVQFDIGMPTNQPLTAVYMLLDGLSSVAILNPSTQFVGSVYGQLDTTVVSNGWHTLQAFADSGIYNESINGTIECSSQIVNLLVTNPITLYVPFAYGGTAPPFTFPIQATFVAPTNNWTIQILTTNTPSTVLKTFSGTSTNGIAYVEWDGTDSSNNPYAGLGVGVTASISDPSSVGPKYSFVGGLTRGNQQAWELAYQGGYSPIATPPAERHSAPCSRTTMDLPALPITVDWLILSALRPRILITPSFRPQRPGIVAVALGRLIALQIGSRFGINLHTEPGPLASFSSPMAPHRGLAAATIASPSGMSSRSCRTIRMLRAFTWAPPSTSASSTDAIPSDGSRRWASHPNN